ncbi:rRNA maturation RNase YbeY [Candidatus Azambacteria bacterium]|nr:rRNA maturation RNase YbeY [Candidatus Azambacteria bacterium]
MPLEINNLTKAKIDEKKLRTVFQNSINRLELKTASISLAFISELEIKKLNKIYRGQNKVTDVLSFGNQDIKEPAFSKLPLEQGFLGEIVICPKFAETKAKLFNLNKKMMINKLLIHGLLHLLGYDHEKSKKQAEEMEKLETSLLSL